MLIPFVAHFVDVCRRRALLVVGIAGILTVLLGAFVATHLRINTDLDTMFASDLAWRQNEQALEQAFPQNQDRLVVVIDAANTDAAEQAATVLAEAMQAARQPLPPNALPGTERRPWFANVTRPDAVPFFRTHGLLLLPLNDLTALTTALARAQPVLGAVAADPSLRGLLGLFALIREGTQHGALDPATLEQPLEALAQSLEVASAGRVVPFPWQSLAGGAGNTGGLAASRKLILAQPALDYGALTPGAEASEVLRRLAVEHDLTPEHGVRVRLTGSVALNDEEFATVAEGAWISTTLSVVLVIVLLTAALRSWRLVAPILVTLAAGLVATTAFGLAAIGSLNLISVAFAVMFIGISVDFGIQFGVRYREARHEESAPAAALRLTARRISGPLTLAALAAASGFVTFIPTAYRGVAELGLITGAGMLIALVLNLTLLPALLTLFHPHAEPKNVGYAWAAPLDRFLLRHRRRVLGVALILGLVGSWGATRVAFDVDPLNLKDPASESVATLRDLMQNPLFSPLTMTALAPTWEDAAALAKRLEALPEVGGVMWLGSFVPEDQDAKLALLQDTSFILGPSLNPPTVAPPPDEAALENALRTAASDLRGLGPSDSPSALRVAATLERIADTHDSALFQRLHATFVDGLLAYLQGLRGALGATPVTQKTLLEATDLREDWVAPDGRLRLEIRPAATLRDRATLVTFTDAVRRVTPEAGGGPLSLRESGEAITRAFVQAGVGALLAISLLAFVALRRLRDVARLLLPLVWAGAMTLGTLTFAGLSLTFANIIALPLLLSLGVSYSIYFVIAWREGAKGLVQSSLARAVLFSAATTTVAFGTFILSSHPGTRGMGILLTFSLLYLLLGTFLVLPALLGPPPRGRAIAEDPRG